MRVTCTIHTTAEAWGVIYWDSAKVGHHLQSILQISSFLYLTIYQILTLLQFHHLRHHHLLDTITEGFLFFEVFGHHGGVEHTIGTTIQCLMLKRVNGLQLINELQQ